MKFTDAYVLMQHGHTATSPSLPPGAYVFLAGGGRIVDGKSVVDAAVAEKMEGTCIFLFGAPTDETLTVQPALCLRTAGGFVQIGWGPSATDLLSSTWTTTPPSPRT